MKQFSLPASIATLLMTWPTPSLAHPQFEVLVQSAIMIQTPPIPAYRLRDQVTELARDGDRLDIVGMAAQSAEQPMVLDLDRDMGSRSRRQIRLLPHSRLRIVQFQALTNGQKRVWLAVEQGQAKLQIDAHPFTAYHSFTAYHHFNLPRFDWRGSDVMQVKPHPSAPAVHPWYLNGMRATGRLLLTGQSEVEQLG